MTANGMGGDLQFHPPIPAHINLTDDVVTTVTIPPLNAWISCRNEREGEIAPADEGWVAVYERLVGAGYWPSPTHMSASARIRRLVLRTGGFYCVVNNDPERMRVVKIAGTGSLFIRHDRYGVPRFLAHDNLPRVVRERITGGLIAA